MPRVVDTGELPYAWLGPSGDITGTGARSDRRPRLNFSRTGGEGARHRLSTAVHAGPGDLLRGLDRLFYTVTGTVRPDPLFDPPFEPPRSLEIEVRLSQPKRWSMAFYWMCASFVAQMIWVWVAWCLGLA
jgi:hypothetical protein